MKRFQSTSHEITDLRPLDTPPTVLQPLDFMEVYRDRKRTLYCKMLAKGHRKAKRSTGGGSGASTKRSAALARQPWVCSLTEDQRGVGLRPSTLVLGLGPALHTQNV